MSRHLRIGAPILALLLALFWAKVQWEFGSMAEPENAGWAQAAFSLGIGLALQLGLFLLPWAVTRGRGVRILVAVLMLPAGIAMVGSLWTAIVRAMNANAMELWVNAIYVVGSAGYIAAYTLLIATKRSPPETVAVATS